MRLRTAVKIVLKQGVNRYSKSQVAMARARVIRGIIRNRKCWLHYIVRQGAALKKVIEGHVNDLAAVLERKRAEAFAGLAGK